MYSGHYTTSINCSKKNLLQRHQNYKFEMIDTKISTIAYVVIYQLIM